MTDDARVSRRKVLVDGLWLPAAAGVIAGVLGGAGGNLVTTWFQNRWEDKSRLSISARPENPIEAYFDTEGHFLPYRIRVSAKNTGDFAEKNVIILMQAAVNAKAGLSSDEPWMDTSSTLLTESVTVSRVEASTIQGVADTAPATGWIASMPLLQAGEWIELSFLARGAILLELVIRSDETGDDALWFPPELEKTEEN